MLKILIVLECDTCRLPLNHIAASKDLNGMEWEVQASDLLDLAEQHCWCIYKASHNCPQCLFREEIETVAMEQAMNTPS